MRLNSWLSFFCFGVTTRARRRIGRGDRRSTIAWPTMIERLQPRRLLSALAVGPETRVNTYTTSNQSAAVIAMDAAGDYVTAWQSFQDGGGFGIYGQRFNAAGTPLGAEFRVNSYTSGFQQLPAIAMDATGDFVVTWQSPDQDGSTYGIYAQRYNSAGIAQGGEFRVNTYTTSIQDSPSVAMDHAGDFVITWRSYSQDGSSYGIYAKRFNASGVAQGTEFKVNTFTTGIQGSPSVAVDAAGDFLIAWQSFGQDGGGYGIEAQRYNAAGTAQGGEFRANTHTTGSQANASVGMDAVGDFAITWDSVGQDGSGSGIYAQRYNSAGVAQGAEIQVNSFTIGIQANPSLAMNATGDFTIAWESAQQDGSQSGVYAQRYSKPGAQLGDVFRINTYTTNSQASSSVGIDAGGNLAIVWASGGQDGDGTGIYSQRFRATGGPFVISVMGGFGPQTVQDGDKLTSTVSFFSITFGDSPISDAGNIHSVTKPSNWRLTRYGVDVTNEISGITGNSTTVNISFTRPLIEGAYQLVALDSIQGLDGRALDGDADGVALGNFYRNFAVSNVVVGPEIHVSSATSLNQVNSSIAADAAGDYVVTWMSNGQDGSIYGVFAQRFNATGTAAGPEFQVNTYTTGVQASPAVAMDAAGNFVITWDSGQDGSSYGIYARRYNAAGVAQGAEFRVNSFTTNSQTVPRIAMEATGDFVITWESYQDGDGPGIYAQRYNAAGTAQGSEFKVNTYTTASQFNPSIAIDASGGFVIAWNSVGEDGSGIGIYAQRFNSIGITQGSEFPVNTYTTGTQKDAAVGMDPAGDFVIVWSSYGEDGSMEGVYARRYDPLGTAQSGEFKVNNFTPNGQRRPVVAFDTAGDFVIAWQSIGQDGSLYGIYAKRYDAAGIPNDNEFKVNTYTLDSQVLPSIAMDPIGDFLIAWNSKYQDGSQYGIYAQRYQGTDDVAPFLFDFESSPRNAVGPLVTPVAPSLIADDIDSDNWTGASIRIGSHYQPSQDQLGFTNTAQITGSWNVATGTLSLTGTDTVADYQAALRNVTFHNTSATPDTTAIRTIEFQATDGFLTSNVVTRQLAVFATIAPPVLSGVSGTGTYGENNPALIIAGNLIASDSSSSNLQSATVSFTNWQAEDRVNFNNIFALHHTFIQNLATHTATLAITGAASIDHYQTLLRSVVYWDVSDNPVTTTRTAHFVVSDGLSSSNVVTRDIAVASVNDPPQLSAIESTPLAYKANDPTFPPPPISLTLAPSDPDSVNLSGATVQIAAGYQNNSGGHDLLSFSNQSGITGLFNAVTGLLTLSGTSTVGNYRTALRSVTFSTSGSAVSVADRKLTIIVKDDFSPTPASSIAVTRIVNVSTSNVPPALTGIPTTSLTYTRGSAAAATAPGLVVLDSDSINLASATIQISGNYQTGLDVLAVTAVAGISRSFNATTGTLTLSGISKLSNYKIELRSVTFKTTSAANTLARTLTFIVNDGLATSSPVTRKITLT